MDISRGRFYWQGTIPILFGLSINDMLTYDGELVQKNIQRTMLRLKNFFNKRKRVGQKRKSKLNA